MLKPKRHTPPIEAHRGALTVKPERLTPPAGASLEGAAIDVLMEAAGRKLRAGQAGAMALATALGPPFRRLGARARKRLRGTR